MKRLIAALVIVAIIVALCVCVSLVITRQLKEVRAMVSQCKECLQKKDSAKAEEIADALVESWEKKEALLSPFINHEKIDEISLEITSLAANIHSNNLPVVLRDAETILMLLHQLEEDEKINLHSIF